MCTTFDSLSSLILTLEGTEGHSCLLEDLYRFKVQIRVRNFGGMRLRSCFFKGTKLAMCIKGYAKVPLRYSIFKTHAFCCIPSTELQKWQLLAVSLHHYFNMVGRTCIFCIALSFAILVNGKTCPYSPDRSQKPLDLSNHVTRVSCKFDFCILYARLWGEWDAHGPRSCTPLTAPSSPAFTRCLW
jgi:hypothetical protein